jgi:hypothetical protein
VYITTNNWLINHEEVASRSPILSCPALPCPVLSCLALSCPVLSCPVLSGVNIQNLPDKLWGPPRVSGYWDPSPLGVRRECAKFTTSSHLVTRLRMSGAISLLPLYAFIMSTGTTLSLHFYCVQFVCPGTSKLSTNLPSIDKLHLPIRSTSTRLGFIEVLGVSMS